MELRRKSLRIHLPQPYSYPKTHLDGNNVIDEMNDESSEINNNILEIDIEVTALGVRVIPLDESGNVPVSEADRQNAAIKDRDVRNDTDIDIPISISNEGTPLKW